MARNTAAKKPLPAVFNIEDTDPYLDAEAGAWLHLEDRRDFPPTKLYADARQEQVAALNAALREQQMKPELCSGKDFAARLRALREDAEPRLPVRLKLLGLLSDRVQAKSADIEKRAAAIKQQRFDAAKAAKASDEDAKKAAALTDAEIIAFDAELYACATVDSENLGFKGQATLTEDLARELYTKRADIRSQVRDFLGKLSEFKRARVVH